MGEMMTTGCDRLPWVAGTAAVGVMIAGVGGKGGSGSGSGSGSESVVAMDVICFFFARCAAARIACGFVLFLL